MQEKDSKSSISKNSLWNLIGFVLPALLGIVTIPLIIKNIGVESMGILTLVWTCIGYFSLFDFGVGRALTFTISDLIGKKQWSSISFHVFSGLVLIFFFGLVGAFLVYLSDSYLVTYFFNPSPTLTESTQLSLLYMAICLPFILFTTGVRGILESFSAFKELNLVKIGMGFFNFLAPYVVSLWTTKLDIIVLVLVLGRIFFSLWHFWILEKYLLQHPEPDIQKRWWSRDNIKRFRFWSDEIRMLFSFSSWITLSNIIGPLMVYADRFLIAKFFTAAETAYYTIPFEAVTKIWILPGALAGVLFPAFAKEFSALSMEQSGYRLSQNKLIELYDNSFKLFVVLLIPLTLIVGLFAKELLQWWLGNEFAYRSTAVFMILGFGVIANCFGQITFALVQGSGASRVTALFHLIELPIYIVLVYFLTKQFGITGTALAWFLRVVLDNALLMSYTYFKIDKHFHKSQQMMVYFIGGVVFFICMFANDLIVPPISITNIFLKLSLSVFLIIISAICFKRFWMKNTDKAFIMSLLQKLPFTKAKVNL